MRNVILALFAIVVVIGLYMIFNPSQAVSPATGQVVGNSQSTNFQTSGSIPQEFSMDIIQGGFEPKELTVKKGIPVTLHLTAKTIADGFKEHGFSIREFGVSAKIPLGETVTVEFTPDKTGSFVFFCNTFCGEGHVGQAGILHVID